MVIRYRIVRFLLLVLLLLLSACSNGMQSATEVVLPTLASDAVLFQDDFSNPKSGWDRASQGRNSTDYADGKYRITLSTPQQDIWANPYNISIKISSSKLMFGKTQAQSKLRMALFVAIAM